MWEVAGMYLIRDLSGQSVKNCWLSVMSQIEYFQCEQKRHNHNKKLSKPVLTITDTLTLPMSTKEDSLPELNACTVEHISGI